MKKKNENMADAEIKESEITKADETTAVLEAVKKILDDNAFSYELTIQVKIIREAGESKVYVDHLAKEQSL